MIIQKVLKSGGKFARGSWLKKWPDQWITSSYIRDGSDMYLTYSDLMATDWVTKPIKKQIKK